MGTQVAVAGIRSLDHSHCRAPLRGGRLPRSVRHDIATPLGSLARFGMFLFIAGDDQLGLSELGF
jgi:hypothetical protein